MSLKSREFSYHLVLAQYVREDQKYADFYEERSARGDFLMLDNGAAENTTLRLHELMHAAETVKPSEIVLPDVMMNKKATLAAGFDEAVLRGIPERMRAVCPQGDSIDEWFECAHLFRDGMDFATMCVPKHLERFEGGRAAVLQRMTDHYWHELYNIHLLGIWGNPFTEVMSFKPYLKVVRGIDTALPFALAQNGLTLDWHTEEHVSHKWGGKFKKSLALPNAETLFNWVWSYE